MSKLGTSQKNASITVERGRLKKCDSQHVNSPDSPVETATLQETNISHIGKAGKFSTEKCQRVRDNYVIVPWRIVILDCTLSRLRRQAIQTVSPFSV